MRKLLIKGLSMLALRQFIALVGDGVGVTELALPLFFAGIGMGTAIAPMFQAILASVGGRDAGSASGALQSFQQMGGGLGVAIMGQIFFSALTNGMAATAGATPHPVFIDSLRSALVYVVIVLAGVAASAFSLSRPSFGNAGHARPAAVPE